MKRLLLITIAVLFSVTAFAQRISIFDICYKEGNLIQTHTVDDIVLRITNKGFYLINTESVRALGPANAYYTYKLYTYYQQSTNTKIKLSEGMPQTIVFASSNDAALFASEAIKARYVIRMDGTYVLTQYEEYSGIEGFDIQGRTLQFVYSQL
jgi:hypothetical protein